MEFEEMTKIWDQQHQKTMYAIDEEVLFMKITSRKHNIEKWANLTEIALVLIAVVTGLILLNDAYQDQEPLSAYVATIPMFLIAVYILIERIRRQKFMQKFGGTIIGDLDHSIHNSNYMERISRTFVWWFMLPAAIGIAINQLGQPFNPGKMIFVAGAFVLAYFVTRIEYRRIHKPRTSKLKALRDQLIREA